MQEIKLSVVQTKDFSFKPTELTIIIKGAKDTDSGKKFDVMTQLTQYTENGSIVETSRLEFTEEQINTVLDGYDYVNSTPKVNKEGNFRHGSYFFYAIDNYFPTIEEAKKIVIDGYNLPFKPTDAKLTIWITEFKNKAEWLKWYHN